MRKDDNLLDMEDPFGAGLDIGFGDEDEPLWDSLIDQIVKGNVIPVVGADLLCEGKSNPHSQLIEYISKWLGVRLSEYRSFSELVYSKEYLAKTRNRKEMIYYQVNKILSQARFTPSQRLMRLLSIRQFPFVITTSFTPVVEQTMRGVWGSELRVMRFNNNPSENDDVRDGLDLRKPTVYYMFGKVCEGAHQYALTDTDMLDFCSSWLSKENHTRPKNLCTELENKYLLMLGNNYSDWLFRFIWYSMRKANMGNGMLSSDTIDEALEHFLLREDAFIKTNPSEVIDQIVTRLERKLSKNEGTKFNRVEEDTDVFISYSRSDRDVAERLYEALTAQGKKVWYDKKNITEGGKFMEEIRKGIRTTKYFVPILSKNIEREINEPHVYRNEWDTALEIMYGRTFVIPIAEEGFDFYHAHIPERLQQHNAIVYSSADDISTVAEKVIHKMNEV